MADDKKPEVVRHQRDVKADDCLHCVFAELAEFLIVMGHDPAHVINQMTGALADTIGGLTDGTRRSDATDTVLVVLPTLVAEAVLLRDAAESGLSPSHTKH